MSRRLTAKVAFAFFVTVCVYPLQARAEAGLIIPITQSWRYSTNSETAPDWYLPGFAETGWSNGSNALLYIETSALPAPKNAALPQRTGGGPMLTYYFRTSFNLTNPANVLALTFSNLIDDGAVFYLNGVEIQRVGMAAGNVTYDTLSTRAPDNATTFDVFSISGNQLTNVVAGTNILAVEVHQQAATSSDIVFGSAVIAMTNISLTRVPYLQNVSHTNVTIRWRTDAGLVGRVRFGTQSAILARVADDIVATTDHEVRVTGLQPDTKYFYSVGTVNAVMAGQTINHFFKTSPVPGTLKPTRIWVIGDAGTAAAGQVSVRNAYQAFSANRPADMWLMLGDNAYTNGTDAEYQAGLFNIYTNQLRNLVFWSTLGNHETYSVNPSGDYPYFDIFSLPKNGEAGGMASGTEYYYSFDYANIHFICLDSMVSSRATNSPMFNWLTNDLANITADWTIAFWHHPAYTKGSHNSDSETELVEMRRVFVPVLEQAGVDLVLAGHSHSYERSFLIDRHYGLAATINATNKIDAGNGRENGTGAYKKPENVSAPHMGAVYAVVGSSGQISGGTLNHQAMYVSLNNLGSMVLDISSNRLDATFIRENGTTNDYFTILKVNFPPVASNLTYNVPADVSTPLVITGSDINSNAITFATDSLPGHGLISGFDATNGTLVYTPAHGFSGSGAFTYHVNDGQTNSSTATVTINTTAAVDSNTNGLPDSFEGLYGVTDPDTDNDGDGLSNLQEYFANTNPTNAASTLAISAITRAANGNVTLNWPAMGGTRYRVNFTDSNSDALPNGDFIELLRPVSEEMNPATIGTLTNQTFTDDFALTGVPTNGARYYRLQVTQ
ncbi:MAG: cadherin-like domain-containing protein [Verrucomicrobia bacterium]|nr:cadherin-like domain-containing protein [Verrucomicrobiota bacterium]